MPNYPLAVSTRPVYREVGWLVGMVEEKKKTVIVTNLAAESPSVTLRRRSPLSTRRENRYALLWSRPPLRISLAFASATHTYPPLSFAPGLSSGLAEGIPFAHVITPRKQRKKAVAVTNPFPGNAAVGRTAQIMPTLADGCRSCRESFLDNFIPSSHSREQLHDCTAAAALLRRVGVLALGNDAPDGGNHVVSGAIAVGNDAGKGRGSVR